MWINAWRWKTRFVSAGFPALILGLLGGWIGSLVSPGVSRTWGQEVTWQLRDQVPTGSEGSAFRPRFRDVSWEPSQTAIIVCDVWDAHHCLNAVRRLNEMVPRLNQVLEQGREQGMLIIHAPSDCMPAYADHPARQRAETIPGLD